MADTKTLHGLDDVLAKLKALPPSIASKRGGPVAKALRKGGAVIQKQAKANIRKAVLTGPDYGYESTKTLEKAVVVRRMSNPQRYGANEGAVVRISQSAKYKNRKTQVTATQVGGFLEHGTEKQPPEPWMTPAYFATRDKALDTIVQELNTEIDKAIAKVSR